MSLNLTQSYKSTFKTMIDLYLRMTIEPILLDPLVDLLIRCLTRSRRVALSVKESVGKLPWFSSLLDSCGQRECVEVSHYDQ